MAQQIALGTLSHKQNIGSASPSKEIRNLKIVLSDKIFQLKKLEEDYAEQKAHILMQFSQQRSHLNSTIRELKDKMAEENEHWAHKIDQLRKENELSLRKNNQEWKSKIVQQVAQQVSQIQTKHEAQVAELKKNVVSLYESINQKQKCFQKKIIGIKESHRAYITQIKQQKQIELEEVKKKLSRDEQLKVNAIMHIKNSEEKQHTNTKNMLLRRQRQYHETIKKLQEKVFVLGQETWSLNNKIKMLQDKNQEQSLQIMKLQERRRSSVQLTNKQYQQKMLQSQTEWKENLQSLNEKWKSEYKKLQVAYQRITAACADKERLWEERGSKVLKLYQLREAREQDVKLIEHLQVQLIKKQFELQRQKQELKTCKLQLDNMDDIYKRIFHSVKKNHRHSHSFQLKKMRLPGIMNRSTHPLKEDQD